MRFSRRDGEVQAERISDGQKFALRPWQYEMMRQFDGERTFESVARDVHAKYRGQFSPVGLTNFYQWLYDENLILCECESVFELVTDEEPQVSVTIPLRKREVQPKEEKGFQESLIEKLGLDGDWQKKALKISAMVLLSLAVLRIAYVAAPIFEPPVNLLYSSIEGYFYQDAKPLAEERSVQPRDTPIEEMELGARAVSQDDTPPVPQQVAPAVTEPIPAPEPYRPTVSDLDDLRRELAECRVRRDEFYIQNNEVGYRYEVQKMTTLVRQIGEVEALLD